MMGNRARGLRERKTSLEATGGTRTHNLANCSGMHIFLRVSQTTTLSRQKFALQYSQIPNKYYGSERLGNKATSAVPL